MGKLIEDPDLRNKVYVFRNRAHAGRMLAVKLLHYASSDALILAIPAGGVPVAYEMTKDLGLTMDIVIVRKVQIPGSTEAGFGAVGPDGEVIFNNALLKALNLTKEEVRMQVDKTKKVLRERNLTYRKGRPFPDLDGRTVILVDDGLASGYTMSEAIRFARRKKSGRTIIASPTASERSIEFLLDLVDELYCLNIRGYPFAVAEAYEEWYDVSDEEVVSLIR
jgi:putative phosphoribosyl transferase